MPHDVQDDVLDEVGLGLLVEPVLENGQQGLDEERVCEDGWWLQLVEFLNSRGQVVDQVVHHHVNFDFLLCVEAQRHFSEVLGLGLHLVARILAWKGGSLPAAQLNLGVKHRNLINHLAKQLLLKLQSLLQRLLTFGLLAECFADGLRLPSKKDGFFIAVFRGLAEEFLADAVNQFLVDHEVLEAARLVGECLQKVLEDFLLGEWVLFGDSAEECGDF